MQLGEVWVEAGELLGQFPDSDDEEKDIQDDDDAHRAEEAPDEAVFQRQPAAKVERKETDVDISLFQCKPLTSLT